MDPNLQNDSPMSLLMAAIDLQLAGSTTAPIAVPKRSERQPVKRRARGESSDKLKKTSKEDDCVVVGVVTADPRKKQSWPITNYALPTTRAVLKFFYSKLQEIYVNGKMVKGWAMEEDEREILKTETGFKDDELDRVWYCCSTRFNLFMKCRQSHAKVEAELRECRPDVAEAYIAESLHFEAIREGIRQQAADIGQKIVRVKVSRGWIKDAPLVKRSQPGRIVSLNEQLEVEDDNIRTFRGPQEVPIFDPTEHRDVGQEETELNLYKGEATRDQPRTQPSELARRGDATFGEYVWPSSNSRVSDSMKRTMRRARPLAEWFYRNLSICEPSNEHLQDIMKRTGMKENSIKTSISLLRKHAATYVATGRPPFVEKDLILFDVPLEALKAAVKKTEAAPKSTSDEVTAAPIEMMRAELPQREQKQSASAEEPSLIVESVLSKEQAKQLNVFNGIFSAKSNCGSEEEIEMVLSAEAVAVLDRLFAVNDTMLAGTPVTDIEKENVKRIAEAVNVTEMEVLAVFEHRQRQSFVARALNDVGYGTRVAKLRASVAKPDALKLDVPLNVSDISQLLQEVSRPRAYRRNPSC